MTNDCSGENGLLLTPSIDHLFDRGFISFESIWRPHHFTSLLTELRWPRMGVETQLPVNVGRNLRKVSSTILNTTGVRSCFAQLSKSHL